MDSSRSAVRVLRLVFAVRGGRTVIRHAYAEAPFKITQLYYPPDSTLAQLILMNTAPGLFPGDRNRIEIRVENGARVLLTSQSFTKVHPGIGIAEQCFQIDVESHAELHIYNDPVIPFCGSRLRQRVTFQVASDAKLRVWDGWMSGRVGRGEAWQFDELDMETRLLREGKLLYLERYKLDSRSADRNIQYVGSGIFHEPLDSAFLDCNQPGLGIDEPVSGLTIVRAIAKDGIQYRRIQHQVLIRAFQCSNQRVPDLRKY